MRMFVKFRDSKSGSQHFSIIREQQTVLRMDRGVNNALRLAIQVLRKLIKTIFPESTCS